MQEEYHRERLMYWRARRSELERQIAEPIDELSEVAERAFQDGDNSPVNPE